MMKLTILHNELDEFVEEKSGFSVLIEAGEKRVLFDVSYSDDIVKNAVRGKIELSDIDYLVLSHGHIDHTGGWNILIFQMLGICWLIPIVLKKSILRE